MQFLFIIGAFGAVIIIPVLLMPILLKCFGISNIGDYGTIMSALAAVLFGTFQYLITKKYTEITGKMQITNDNLLKVNEEINRLNQQNTEIEQKRLLMDLQPNIEFSVDAESLHLTNRSSYPVWFYGATTNTFGTEPQDITQSAGKVQISQNTTKINFSVGFNSNALTNEAKMITLKVKILLSNVLDEPYSLRIENNYSVRLDQNQKPEIIAANSLLTDIQKLEKFPWE